MFVVFNIYSNVPQPATAQAYADEDAARAELRRRLNGEWFTAVQIENTLALKPWGTAFGRDEEDGVWVLEVDDHETH